MYRPTLQAALAEIADVAARRRDCDCTDLANIAKIRDLATKAHREAAGWPLMIEILNIADNYGAQRDATDRMRLIADVAERALRATHAEYADHA